jgi:hypothetical protein
LKLLYRGRHSAKDFIVKETGFNLTGIYRHDRAQVAGQFALNITTMEDLASASVNIGIKTGLFE